MATTSNPGGQQPATPQSTGGQQPTTPQSTGGQQPTTPHSSATRKPASRTKSTARKSAATTKTTHRSTPRSSTSTQPKTRVGQAQQLAERAVLVPVGASILAHENLVSTIKGFATKYRTRESLERELTRYERRGATARNRFE